MTSAVATIGLTFDGQDLQTSDLSIFLEIVRGLNEPPTVRGKDITVPALAGRIEANRVNDVLPIELRGLVRASSSATDRDDQMASFRANVSAVRALFATNRARADLVATLEDGTEQSISARPLNLVWGEVIQSEYATVSIELEGYDDWGAAGS